jgi:hypothetical protein
MSRRERALNAQKRSGERFRGCKDDTRQEFEVSDEHTRTSSAPVLLAKVSSVDCRSLTCGISVTTIDDQACAHRQGHGKLGSLVVASDIVPAAGQQATETDLPKKKKTNQ